MVSAPLEMKHFRKFYSKTSLGMSQAVNRRFLPVMVTTMSTAHNEVLQLLYPFYTSCHYSIKAYSVCLKKKKKKNLKKSATEVRATWNIHVHVDLLPYDW